MANFCVYCGKPLGENETCSCQQKAAEPKDELVFETAKDAAPAQTTQQAASGQQAPSQAAPQGQPNYQQAPQGQFQQGQPNYQQAPQGQFQQGQPNYQQAPQGQFQQGQPIGQPGQPYQQPYQQPNPAVQAIGSGFKALLTMFNKPTESLLNFVKPENFIVAFILFAVQAVLSALFTKAAGGALITFEVMAKVMVYSVILSAVFYGVIFLFVLIFKGNTNWASVLCTAAVRSAIVIPFTVVAILLSFMSPGLAVGFFFGSELFAAFFVFHALKLTSNIREELLIYVVPVAMALVVLVFGIILKNEITSLAMSGLSSLGGALGSSALRGFSNGLGLD